MSVQQSTIDVSKRDKFITRALKPYPEQTRAIILRRARGERPSSIASDLGLPAYDVDGLCRSTAMALWMRWGRKVNLLWSLENDAR